MVPHCLITMSKNYEQNIDELKSSQEKDPINDELNELGHRPLLIDMFGEAGVSYLIARYNSNKTFLGVIFGFAMATFVAMIVHISSSHITISSFHNAYGGLMLLAIVMSVSGSITIIEVYRYDSMWPLSQDKMGGKQFSIIQFTKSVMKSHEQLKRIEICRWQEFAEALLVSGFILSIGLIVFDLIDNVLGEVIVTSSIILWILTIMLFLRVAIPILCEMILD